MNAEKWRATPGFSGYEVSNQGQVRSYWKQTASGWEIDNRPSRILSGGGKYRGVVLCQSGQQFQRKIAHLVTLAFLGPCPEGLEVCHNDGNPQNDRLNNLRYDTHTSNMQDASRQTQWASGAAHAGSQHTNEFARQLREEFASGMSTPSLARKYNLRRRQVSGIVYGHIYKDAGGPIAKSTLLSGDEVEEIRRKRDNGASLKELAKAYGLSISGISRIASGQRHNKAGDPATKSTLLSNDEVEELRHKRARGASLKELSEEYGLSKSGVSRIASGQRRNKAGGPTQLLPRRA